MRTSEQLRAADAYSSVTALSGEPEEFRRLYRAYVDRLGPTIIMNGLGQALATELAAGGQGTAHRMLYHNLQGWLCHEDGGIYPHDSDLLQAIINNDQSLYLLAQAEALVWLEWHKKFCRATLPFGRGE